jgi:hypothetical protein
LEQNFPFNLAASGARDRLLLLPFLSILLIRYVWMYVCNVITIGDEILFFLILPCIPLVLAAVSQSIFFVAVLVRQFGFLQVCVRIGWIISKQQGRIS